MIEVVPDVIVHVLFPFTRIAGIDGGPVLEVSEVKFMVPPIPPISISCGAVIWLPAAVVTLIDPPPERAEMPVA